MTVIRQGEGADGPGSARDRGADPPAAFDGRRRALAAILIRNLLLNVATFGFYRFWAKTRLRRYVWRHVRFLGDPLEYLGTARELLTGFLVAVAVLAPLFGLYFLVEFFVGGAFAAAPLVLDAFYYLALFLLVEVAVYRVRRYRLTRTAWRGVRFGLGGSSLEYALISGGYGLAALATLGFAYPWWRVATVRYAARHARFGVARLALEADARWLFRRWLAVAAPVATAVAAFVWINGWTFGPLASDFGRFVSEAGHAGANDVVDGSYLKRIQFWPLALVLTSPVLWIWYRAVEFRHLIGGTRVGGMAFDSGLRGGYVFKAYALFLATLIGASFLAGVAAATMISLVFLESTAFSGGIFAMSFLTINVLFYNFVRTLILDFALLRHVCETLRPSDRHALDGVEQSPEGVPRRGEGLADALDVGGF